MTEKEQEIKMKELYADAYHYPEPGKNLTEYDIRWNEAMKKIEESLE